MPIPADVVRVHDAWRQRGRFIALAEGHRIFTVQDGQGPDVVLVHGFPCLDILGRIARYPQMETPEAWVAAVTRGW